MTNKNLTVVELRQLCRDKGLTGYSKLNKEGLIKLCKKKVSKKSSKTVQKQKTENNNVSKKSSKIDKKEKPENWILNVVDEELKEYLKKGKLDENGIWWHDTMPKDIVRLCR